MTGIERKVSGGGGAAGRGTMPKTSCRYSLAAASPVPLVSSSTSPLGSDTVTASVPGGSASVSETAACGQHVEGKARACQARRADHSQWQAALLTTKASTTRPRQEHHAKYIDSESTFVPATVARSSGAVVTKS